MPANSVIDPQWEKHNDDIADIALTRTSKGFRFEKFSTPVEGMSQPKYYPVDSWRTVNPAAITNTSNAKPESMAYDYQIIIQLSDEPEILQGDERLASKHPDKTVIIQYDIKSGEYATVYGDLTKMEGDNVRWILSSHGSKKVNGNNTRFADLSANQLATGLAELRAKNPIFVNPNRIILAGCNLGSEANADHYGLRAARMLWNNGFTASVRAYTEDLTVNVMGERHTIDGIHLGTQRRKYRPHRIDYTKQPDKPVMVNNVSAMQLLINDISNEKISFDQATTQYADIINYYLPDDDRVVSLSLLKEIVNNDERYTQFNDYIDKTLDGELPTTVKFTDYLLLRGNPYKLSVVNTWNMVNPELIYANLLAKKSAFAYDYQVIFQFSDDVKVIEGDELLASKHPDKTVIVQYDITSKESRVVYGDFNKLSGNRVRWVLSGHGDGERHLFERYKADDVYTALDALKKERKMVSPQRVVLFSCELGRNPDDGLTKHFALEYAEAMQRNKDMASLRAYTEEVALHDTGERITYNSDTKKLFSKEPGHRVDYQMSANGQLLINDISIVNYILLDIVAENITAEDAIKQYKQHLEHYFADSNGEIDISILSQTANDPHQWEKFTHHVVNNQDKSDAKKGTSWFTDKEVSTLKLSETTHRAATTYEHLADGRAKYHQLSEQSQRELQPFISGDEGSSGERELYLLLADETKKQDKYIAFEELKKINLNNELDHLTPGEALSLVDRAHQVQTESLFSLDKHIASHLLKGIDYKISVLTRSLYLDIDGKQKNSHQENLGYAYLDAAAKGESAQLNKLIDTYDHLMTLKASGKTSQYEDEQIDKIAHLFDRVKNNALSVNQNKKGILSLNRIINDLDIGYYQLKTDKKTISLSIKQENGIYSYHLFDSEMGELVLSGNNKNEVSYVANESLIKYFSDEISHPDYKTRAERYGLKYSDGDYSFDVYSIDLSKEKNYCFNELSQLTRRGIKTERTLLADLGKIKVEIGDVSLVTLYDMGATVDGKLISSRMITTDPLWSSKIIFDAKTFNDNLLFVENDEEENIEKIKLLDRIIKNNGAEKLLSHHDGYEFIEARKYLSGVERYVSDTKIDPKLWAEFDYIKTKSNRLGRVSNKAGLLSQGLGISKLIISTNMMVKKHHLPTTTESEKRQIEKELALNWGEFFSDLGVDLMQPLFNRGTDFFAKKMLQSKGLNHFGYRAGRLATKAAAPVLNFASAGFDIYSIITIYGELENEKDPDKARDLLVNGSLSAGGAAVGILTGVALACGISAAGPIGIFAGLAITLSTMIYNAVVQIAKIKEEIELTPWEEFKNGTRLAFGGGLESEIDERLQRKLNKNRIEALDVYHKEIFEKRLTVAGVTDYHYTYDNKKEQHYFYISKARNTFLLDQLDLQKEANTVNFTRSHADTEKLRSKSLTNGIMNEEIYKKNWIRCSAREIEQYRHSSEYLVEERMVDTYGVSENTNVAVILDREYFDSHYSSGSIEYDNIKSLADHSSERVGNISIESSADKKVHFNTGVGEAYVFAQRDVRNSFDLTEGKKTFVGGNLDDIFYLHGNELFTSREQSFIDGRSGDDTLAIVGVNGKNVNGYNVDLQAGTVHYIYPKELPGSTNAPRVLMKITNIEHVQGVEDTDDIFIGNEQTNYLNGVGGNDILKGYGGSDMLSLQAGEAYGGTGQDNYKISQNTQNKSVAVNIFEEIDREYSNVIFDHYIEDIKNIYLSNNNVHVEIENNNKTLTTVVLNDVYKDVSENYKVKNHDFVLFTKDGFVLTPRWSQVLTKNEKGEWLFTPKLDAYLAITKNKLSTSTNVDEDIEKTFLSKKEQGDVIQINNSMVTLSPFIDLTLTGNPFSIDTLEGHSKDNVFGLLGAGDTVYLSKGNDIYLIDTMVLRDGDKHDTLTLSNRGQHDWTTDQEHTFVFNDVSVDDLHFYSKIVDNEYKYFISHKYHPEKYLKILLPIAEKYNNYYNKFFVIDKSKQRFIFEYNFIDTVISSDSTSNQSLSEVIEATEENDVIVINESHQIKEDSIDGMGGNDIITDLSGGSHKLHGGEGDDILVTVGGNSFLSGGEGNDRLFAGAGNDILEAEYGHDRLEGGAGDDKYFISYSYDFEGAVINDIGGNDVLQIRGIGSRDLWLEKNADNLEVTSRNHWGTIIIKNYYRDDSAKIERIALYDRVLQADDIDRLANEMATSPDRKPQHNIFANKDDFYSRLRPLTFNVLVQ
jgi:Ca2+-binding RTX toxin-like protein